jgi:hypothetical protein
MHPSSLSVLDRRIQKDDVKACARGDVRNTCTHHAGTEYTEPLQPEFWRISRSP